LRVFEEIAESARAGFGEKLGCYSRIDTFPTKNRNLPYFREVLKQKHRRIAALVKKGPKGGQIAFA
jgi:hypothetical protein